jgi:hypothetical protein
MFLTVHLGKKSPVFGELIYERRASVRNDLLKTFVLLHDDHNVIVNRQPGRPGAISTGRPI